MSLDVFPSPLFSHVVQGKVPSYYVFLFCHSCYQPNLFDNPIQQHDLFTGTVYS